MKKKKISPSLMCMSLSFFQDQINFLSRKAESFHVDIMDGHFVPNLTLSPWFIQEVRKLSDLPISAHLMVKDQSFWVEKMIELKCEWICMHAEAINGKAFRLIDQIHDANLKAGVVLNPETPVEVLFPYIEKLDKVTIMTVDPGFAGQPFIESTLAKIKELRELKERKQYQYLIEMDGSSNRQTFKSIDQVDPDIYVVGSSGLFGLSDNIETSWGIMSQDFYETTGKSLN
ncbi:D-allulose 6-phosphate 3-epimerase [Streptococcus dysgalactiae]|uniref:D-allulose 6-phosphate 3-epimerase n=1 Tax=Streptococcus dysgalactiae TaxID=1334 RepID=UPI0010CAB3D2|nr:D-allulose 6-phosphate 3-epimerase [Streptococcus dysgalactiae]VTS24861.1 allulose-6-phosphate 3-epimerase [Streptococcus dysgalactiae subsp. equisimilis]